MDLTQVNGLGTTPVKKYMGYDPSQMEKAIQSVRKGDFTPNKAAKVYEVPRKTLTDHLKGRHPLTTGGQTALRDEEETALVGYITQMAEWGHPISVPILKALAGEIHARSCTTDGLTPKFRGCEATGKLVAGRKWWRGFKKRHPRIAARAQDPLSRERARMSSQAVVDEFFNMYTRIMEDNGLGKKPHLIHNCDETGVSMQMNRGRVLVPKGVRGVPSASSGTKDRVTFHIAITAEGKTLAPMIIYKKSFPSGAYSQTGPDNTLYAVSDAGFMDKQLFEKWFCYHYIPSLTNERPVLLLLDQCEAHLSVKTIQTAMDEDIILLGLPPHTSHFLQPLDMTCFSSLKDTLGSIVQGLMYENAAFQLSKRNISKVLKAAYEKSFTMCTVKKGFESTGMYPCNKGAVSRRWLAVGEPVADVTHAPSPTSSEVTHAPSTSCQPCKTPGCQVCGPPRANALVGRMIPASLSDLLVPPQVVERTRVSKAIKTARVFTTEDVLQEQVEKKKKREERLAKKKNKGQGKTEEERGEEKENEDKAQNPRTEKKRKREVRQKLPEEQKKEKRKRSEEGEKQDEELTVATTSLSLRGTRSRRPPVWASGYVMSTTGTEEEYVTEG